MQEERLPKKNVDFKEEDHKKDNWVNRGRVWKNGNAWGTFGINSLQGEHDNPNFIFSS